MFTESPSVRITMKGDFTTAIFSYCGFHNDFILLTLNLISISLEESKINNAQEHYASGKRNLWIVVVLGFVMATLALLNLTPPLVYIRWIFGFLYVLFIPGFTIIQALFPRLDEISFMERVVLSLGLNAIVASLAGFVLGYLGIGAHPTNVLVSLVALSIFFAITALFRVK